jgi:bifunctional non-homologous end joining protein LigD
MLKEYHRKRDFRKTPEPPGQEKEQNESPLRFVVHKHDASHLHWDLRLELDGVLKSWAIPKGPSLDPHQKKLAMMVEDHPLDYREFEGVIPEGNYGAGPVMIWDRGTYGAAGPKQAPPEGLDSEEVLRKGLEKGHISFILKGKRLKGEFALVRLRKAKENAWLLIKARDEFAGEETIADQDTSVASGRTMEEIRRNVPDTSRLDLSGAPRAPFPTGLKPMLATLVDKPFDRPGWLFEIKWDGYRVLAHIKDGRVRLYSRNNKLLNELFAPIADSLQAFPFDVLLDGEVIVVDESGKANFQLLQNYLRSHQGTLVYYVFDLLHLKGHDLRKLPLERRKSILQQVLPALPNVKLSEHVEGEGLSLFRIVKENDIEGIVAKESHSPYRSGQRSMDWLKVKTHRRQEAVIGGFTEPRGGRKGFGSLVLGVYDDGRFTYIGHAGGGFTDDQLVTIRRRLEKIATKASPFQSAPKTNTAVTWVEPTLVSDVRFTEWTNEGLMRHPMVLGFLEDRDARDVTREVPQPSPASTLPVGNGKTRTAPTKKRGRLVIVNDEKVQLTNLDKIFWPDEGYTKEDLIDYYSDISPFLLPYLKDRPESLHRFPDGISGESFYQKNVDHKVPAWVRTFKIASESDNKDTTYLLCQDVATLVYMANLGCIEINPWHSRIPNVDYPDYLVLDLDPLDIAFGEVVKAALETRRVLTEIGAEAFCKTSGATGLHIYVPLAARYTEDQATQFAMLVNLLVHNRLPETTSIERSPEKRRGRVYLDYLQNGRGQTLAAAYCIRPRKHATVSTPLRWEEVNKKLDPAQFTMKTIFKRLEQSGDLWQGVLGPGIDMEECLSRLEDLL